MVKVNAGVANGEITELAAERILMTFFQISQEEASKLIEIPERPPQVEVEE